jgi:drug/metabolite transporter (DMT)-like permease
VFAALLLALLASLSWGLADFVAGVQARHLPVLSVLAVSQPAGLAVAAIWVAAAGGSRPPLGELLAAAAAGVAGALALGALWQAMALGMLGLASPISATGVLVPVTYGLVRGEAPGFLQLAGAGLAVIGVIVAVTAPRFGGPPGGGEALSVIFASGAALGFGALFVGVAVAAKHNPAWAVCAARAGGCTAIAAGAITARSMRRRLAPPCRELPRLGAIGLLDVGGSSLFAVAVHSGRISLIAVAASLYPAVTVILATRMLGERLGVSQRVAVVAMLVGVAAMAAGS